MATRRRTAKQQAADRLRSGRPRERAKAAIRATQPNCHLCGYPIDLALDRKRHPLASSIDELVPVDYGGSTLDPANLRHAHRICNGSRGTKPITPEVRARCRTLVENVLRRPLSPSYTRSW